MDRFTVSEKTEVEHQAMMGLLVEAGYAVGRWQGMWGKLLKQSDINHIDLKRLMDIKPSGYDHRGFVRNRLQKKDWIKFF